MDGLSRPKMFGLSHMLVARKSLEDLFKLGHLELVTAESYLLLPKKDPHMRGESVRSSAHDRRAARCWQNNGMLIHCRFLFQSIHCSDYTQW